MIGGLKCVTETLRKSNIREKIKKTYTRYLDHETYGKYSKHGNYYYFFHNNGKQEHDVLKRVRRIGDKPETFIDVNKLSKNGLVGLENVEFSKDGSMIAYSLIINGSDWTTIKFKKADGTDLPDVLKNVKFSEVKFVFGTKGCIYGTYPKHGKIDENHSLYYHKMGTQQNNDFVLVEDKESRDSMISSQVSEDEKYLIVYYGEGEYSRVSYYNISNINEFSTKIHPIPIFNKADA
uniref:Peptidase_S9_N domain-containing protein n=1 Tax=Parastrongyloides trichosuri TaxID=131310 RepID=A0A0N4ZM75_PARTI